MSRALTLFYCGRHEDVIESANAGLLLYDPERHAPLAYVFGQDTGVYCHVAAAMSLWHLGYPDRAVERIERAIALAERVRHPYSLAGAVNLAAIVRIYRREFGLGEAPSRRLREIANEQGFPFWRGPAAVMWELCGPARGEERENYERALSVFEAAMRIHLVEFLAYAADADLRHGRVEAGLAWIARAKERLEVALDVEFAPEVARLEGELLLLRDGGAPAVEACFERALALAREQKSRSLELRAATSLARLWRDQGQCTEAHAVLAPVYGGFTEGFATQDLRDARAVLEELRP
jgi:tetratricopeptide (TPR) repeat protein